eukprot:TRINITY_DN4397_c0_g2_i1.p1 TRINITY_DN4397_c0_g2~~TRINITY_DN4397_c0_g2_i1.p1  ORF type:complete len:317 (+),score=45.47 TRINITY_DN4397_c0_g2_i1:48-998(+)
MPSVALLLIILSAGWLCLGDVTCSNDWQCRYNGDASAQCVAAACTCGVGKGPSCLSRAPIPTTAVVLGWDGVACSQYHTTHETTIVDLVMSAAQPATRLRSTSVCTGNVLAIGIVMTSSQESSESLSVSVFNLLSSDNRYGSAYAFLRGPPSTVKRTPGAGDACPADNSVETLTLLSLCNALVCSPHSKHYHSTRSADYCHIDKSSSTFDGRSGYGIMTAIVLTSFLASVVTLYYCLRYKYPEFGRPTMKQMSTEDKQKAREAHIERIRLWEMERAGGEDAGAEEMKEESGNEEEVEEGRDEEKEGGEKRNEPVSV